jgi:NADP-dependent 3-hydroxy acid dehydrogenase YdfG
MRPIEQQSILITGATSGLGQELARALAEKGATLLLHGRDAKRGREIVAQIRGSTGIANLLCWRLFVSLRGWKATPKSKENPTTNER